jgi:quinol-cytochrome oxidoreductase complex cytochrome b subunit
VHAPAHLAPPTTAQRLGKLSFWTVGISLVVMTLTGIWLAFEYEPGGGAVTSLHRMVGVVAVVAALVGAVCTVADAERSTVGILPSIVVLLAAGGLYLTGPTLAWDELTATGPVTLKGITVAFDGDVNGVINGDQAILVDDYKRVAYLHVVGLPLLVIVMGAAGLWAARRNARVG